MVLGAWCLGPGPARLRLATLLISLCQIERQALERHGEIDVLELHTLWHPQRAWREVEDRLDAGADDGVHHLLGRLRPVPECNGMYRTYAGIPGAKLRDGLAGVPSIKIDG